ncbi:MAG: hypothetical protein LBC88_01235 [Spirochaetaceae bacterium]|jgi:hypothetical protein|nr:hypothetical protein [Spirochaetaceae bacterium]
MGSIERAAPGRVRAGRFVFFPVFCLTIGAVVILSGQNAPGLPRGDTGALSSLQAELLTLESRLAAFPPSSMERNIVLRRLARLRSLAGDLEKAVENWTGAAFVTSPPDPASLLEAARCYIALGDYLSADRMIGLVLNGSAPPDLLREAQYFAAVSAAFRTGNTEALASLLPVPEYADKKSALLYMIWRLAADENALTRLLAECPLSPEASIVRETAPINAPARPMWLFPGGREGIIVAERFSLSQEPAAPPLSTAENRPALLQTGLFSREENARSMMERLSRAGFSVVMNRRDVNGSVFFVVGVPPGDTVNTTIIRLRDAGFEAFPVY